MTETFLDGKVVLHAGDCVDVMRSLPEASVDAIVCDPPYGLGFMGKKWDTPGAMVQRKAATENKWDHVGGNHNPSNSADAARTARVEGKRFGEWCEVWATEALRVLKPGGHLVAFSGTRTYHRMACAIEDAGFEVRDQLAFAYGSGFPKSLDVSKAIDKAAGAEREVVGVRDPRGMYDGKVRASAAINTNWRNAEGRDDTRDLSRQVMSAPATDAARQWSGWGTALKPAWEPICLARKPLIGTVVQNVLKHGTGALNVDGCRVETDENPSGARRASASPIREAGSWANDRRSPETYAAVRPGEALGRFPANLVHDGSEEVLECFPEQQSGAPGIKRGGNEGAAYGAESRPPGTQMSGFGDAGSAARFYYTAKADASDRIGSKHPTVKPVDLMQWLCRLVCPKGGVVLDPFAGTGTTGEAAWREGMRAILIEREEEYREDIRRRMDLAVKPTKRAAVAKTKGKLDQAPATPLEALMRGDP